MVRVKKTKEHPLNENSEQINLDYMREQMVSEITKTLREEFFNMLDKEYEDKLKELQQSFNRKVEEIWRQVSEQIRPDHFKELRERLNDSAKSLTKTKVYTKEINDLIANFAEWEQKYERIKSHQEIMAAVHEVMGQIKVLNRAKQTVIENLGVQLNMLTRALRMKGGLFEEEEV